MSVFSDLLKVSNAILDRRDVLRLLLELGGLLLSLFCNLIHCLIKCGLIDVINEFLALINYC